MGSRLRANPDKLFEVFVEVGQPENDGEDPFILRKFPENYDKQDVLTEIPKFAFASKSKISQVDQFSFVLTDEEGMFRFIYCRHGSGTHTCLCIMSHLPWFEVFYRMLNFLADIVNRLENSDPLPFLKATIQQTVPAPDATVTIAAAEDMFNFVVPDPTHLPSIPASRNLTEYYNAVDANNMMRVFSSMLHERRIIFTSRKLSRITGCVHASENLLYPMHWQHLYIPVLPAHLIDYITAPMPYLIGVHSSLMEIIRQKKMDIGDAVIVNADRNEVQTQYYDLEDLPRPVLSYLTQHLRTQKVQSSMTQSGDAISRAFLMATVRLIGGYRDALKRPAGQSITFDQNAFVLSSKSRSTQAFMEKLLQCQCFQQFVNGRVELLNEGQGIYDLFEQESIKYKEYRSKNSGKLKIFSGIQKVKVQGKKMISLVTEKTETSSHKRSKEISVQQPATVSGARAKASKPPLPPPPKVSSSFHTHNAGSAISAREKRHSQDCSHMFQRDSLVDATDMQNSLRRAASAETVQAAADYGDVHSTSSSDGLTHSFEDLSDIAQSELAPAHHDTPSLSTVSSKAGFAGPSPVPNEGTESTKGTSQLVSPPIPKSRSWKLLLATGSADSCETVAPPHLVRRRPLTHHERQLFEDSSKEQEETDGFDSSSARDLSVPKFKDDESGNNNNTSSLLISSKSPKNMFTRTQTYRQAVTQKPLYPGQQSDDKVDRTASEPHAVADTLPQPSKRLQGSIARSSNGLDREDEYKDNNSGSVLRDSSGNNASSDHSVPSEHTRKLGRSSFYILSHPLLQPCYHAPSETPSDRSQDTPSSTPLEPTSNQRSKLTDNSWIAAKPRQKSAPRRLSGIHTDQKQSKKPSVATLTRLYNNLDVNANTKVLPGSKLSGHTRDLTHDTNM